MFESFFRTLVFVGVASAAAVWLGLGLGVGLALGATGLYRRRWLVRAAMGFDVLVATLEYLPSIAVGLVLAWAFVNVETSWLKLTEMALAMGIFWAAPIARSVDSIIRTEFERNYARQWVVFGLGPIRHIVLRMILPGARRRLAVLVTNVLCMGVVVDTSIGYVMRFASVLQDTAIIWYGNSAGEYLAAHVHRPVEFFPALALVVAIVLGLSALSQRLGAQAEAFHDQRRWEQMSADPSQVLEVRSLELGLGGPSSFRMQAGYLSVASGDVIWLSGASGSGKSLFFKALMGLLPPGSHAAGGLRGPGESIFAQTELIFQEPALYLFPYLRVERLVRELGFDHIQSLAGISTELGSRFVRQCSAGQKRLVFNGLLMRRLEDAQGKRLLLCDEPDASLDPDNRDALLTQIARLRDRHPEIAVIFITHDKEVGRALSVIGGARFRVIGANEGRIAELRELPVPVAAPVLPPAAGRSWDVALRLSGLTVPHIVVDGRRAVEDVELHLLQGERLALVSRNGRGKSTLLRALMNLVPRSVEYFELLGEDVVDHDFRRMARHIAYLYEDCEQSFPPGIRLGQLIEWFSLENHLSPEAFCRRIEEAGLPPGIGGRFPGDLSGGQRQLLSFFLATACADKRVVLMDEPFTRLDDANRHRLLGLINRDKDHAYIIVTHQREDIDRLGCRVQYLNAEEERWYGSQGLRRSAAG